jgi:cell division protein FtsN
MRLKCLLMKATMTTLSFLVIGCATSEQNATKTAPIGFITTPASYYTSAKARYLGTKYKENLDRLAERIVRNPKTAGLQFANNIASVGGIGFFTHSAASTADERFLEVIVSAPETFESKGDLNSKLASVFSAYGTELLSILAGDSDIYQEREVSGYGLNLTWRSIIPDSKGTRVVLERAVIYVPKGEARAFLHQDIDQKKFLADAIIFTAADNGPMRLVSYRQQDPRLDTRLPIQEESLVGPQVKTGAQPRPETVTAAPPSLPGAGGTREEQVTLGKPIETVKEDAGASKQSRDDSHDRPPEATVKEPVAQPRLAPSKTPEIAKVAAAEATRSQGSTGGNLAPGKSGPTLKSADDNRRAVLSKSTTGAQASPIAEARPKVEKKVALLTSEPSPVPGKNSLVGSSEPQRLSGTVLPTQRNPVKVAKAAPDRFATGMARGDPRRGATADAASTTDAGTSAAEKNRDLAHAAKGEGKIPTVPAALTTPSPERSSPSTADKTASERIALQKNKTSEIMPKAKSGAAPRSKALEGYIIQLAFKDKVDARRWAESLEQRGYAVSVTEAGGVEAVRVRVGNFLFREEADRQLMALKQEGLAGIVINLPQAYRPDARTPSSDGSERRPAQLPHGDAEEPNGKG